MVDYKDYLEKSKKKQEDIMKEEQSQTKLFEEENGE